MGDDSQSDLLSPLSDIQLTRLLLAELHDDLFGKVARFRQLSDLSAALGRYGTMLPGGEITLAAWEEARSSFVHGNYVATVLLCQGLAEHTLAAHLSMALEPADLPKRITFSDTLDRCLASGVISDAEAKDMRRLMELRNPLSHFRKIDDPSSLTQRVLDSRLMADHHLLSDASFAIGVAIRLLALSAFRVDR